MFCTAITSDLLRLTILIGIAGGATLGSSRVGPFTAKSVVVEGVVLTRRGIGSAERPLRPRPVEGARVYLKASPEGWSLPAPSQPPLELKLSDGRIVPDFACIEVNRTLLIDHNGEGHNFYARSPVRGEWGRALPPYSGSFTDRFLKPDYNVRLTCDIHPWENATLQVVPTPFHTMTDAEGRFELPLCLPEGEYQLEAFYPGLGWAQQGFSVGPGGDRLAVELLLRGRWTRAEIDPPSPRPSARESQRP